MCWLFVASFNHRLRIELSKVFDPRSFSDCVHVTFSRVFGVEGDDGILNFICIGFKDITWFVFTALQQIVVDFNNGLHAV